LARGDMAMGMPFSRVIRRASSSVRAQGVGEPLHQLGSFRACSSDCETQPPITSSTRAASRPLGSTSALRTVASRSTGCHLDRRRRVCPCRRRCARPRQCRVVHLEILWMEGGLSDRGSWIRCRSTALQLLRERAGPPERLGVSTHSAWSAWGERRGRVSRPAERPGRRPRPAAGRRRR